MISLKDEKNTFYEQQKKKKKATYAKKRFLQMKIMKMNLKYTKKVRDCWHYTGKFRRAAHNICNLRYKAPKLYFTMVEHLIIIL